MNVRKFLALVLGLVLAVSLVACGDSSSTASDQGKTDSTGEETSGDLGDFPSKDIRMLIPYAAGGNSDLNARKLAEIIDKYDLLNGHQLVVTNIQGSATQE